MANNMSGCFFSETRCILRTLGLYVYLQLLWYNRPENLRNSVKNAK